MIANQLLVEGDVGTEDLIYKDAAQLTTYPIDINMLVGLYAALWLMQTPFSSVCALARPSSAIHKNSVIASSGKGKCWPLCVSITAKQASSPCR